MLISRILKDHRQTKYHPQADLIVSYHFFSTISRYDIQQSCQINNEMMAHPLERLRLRVVRSPSYHHRRTLTLPIQRKQTFYSKQKLMFETEPNPKPIQTHYLQQLKHPTGGYHKYYHLSPTDHSAKVMFSQSHPIRIL